MRGLRRSGLGGEQSTGGDPGLLPLSTVDGRFPLASREDLEHPLDAAHPRGHQRAVEIIESTAPGGQVGASRPTLWQRPLRIADPQQ